jgi:hypothetical protein
LTRLQVWKVFMDPVQPYPNAKELLSLCAAHYTFPLEQLRPLTALRLAKNQPPASPAFEGLQGAAFARREAASEVETGSGETSSEATSESTPADSDDQSDLPAVPTTAVYSCAQGRDERQWAFVSYHRLREKLEDTVLHLLERFYGRRWYCSCGKKGRDAVFAWKARPAANTCSCAAHLDAFSASLHSEQDSIGTCIPVQYHLNLRGLCGNLPTGWSAYLQGLSCRGTSTR